MRPFLRIFTITLFLLASKIYTDDSQAKPSLPKPLHVALLIEELDPFWTSFIRNMQVAGEQLKIDVTVHQGDGSHLAMIQKAEELARGPHRPDVLMFKSFKNNGEHILRIATQHHIKAFSVNAPIQMGSIPYSPALIGELLPDDEQAGYELVKALRAKMLSRKLTHIHLIAINGDQADSPAQLRAKGLQRAIREFKDVTLHQLVYDGWAAPQTAERFKLLKQRYPMVNAVWGGNDVIALRVVKQAKASGLRLGESIFIGGIDISPEGLNAVANGDMVASIGGHILDGARALVLLFDYSKFGKLEQKSWLTPMLPVTAAEVSLYSRLLDPKKKVPIDFRRYSKWLNPKSSYDFRILGD